MEYSAHLVLEIELVITMLSNFEREGAFKNLAF